MIILYGYKKLFVTSRLLGDRGWNWGPEVDIQTFNYTLLGLTTYCCVMKRPNLQPVTGSNPEWNGRALCDVWKEVKGHDLVSFVNVKMSIITQRPLISVGNTVISP